MIRFRAPGPLALAVAVLCTLAILGSMVALGPVGTAAGASTTITGCTTIDQPGRYVLGSDVTNTSIGGGDACLAVAADDVVLDGAGHVVAGGSSGVGVRVGGGSDVTNVTVRDLAVESWDDGIVVEGVDDGRFVGVTASANAGDGIAIDSVQTVSVVGSTFADNGDDGIGVAGTDGTSADLSTVRIRDTAVRNNADAGVLLAGVTGARLDNLTVVRNRDGILGVEQFNAFVANGPTANVTVRDSDVSRNDRDGVRIGGFFDATHSSNAVVDSTLALNGRDGINATDDVDGLLIEGTVVSSSGDDGIRINGSDDVLARNVTTRSNGDEGIVVEFGENLTLAGVEVAGNGDTALVGSGIDIDETSDVTLSRIDAVDNDGTGIEIRDVEGLTAERLYVARNVNGLELYGLSSRVRVRDSRFVDGASTGARLAGTSDNRYTNLTARRNDQNGFRLGSLGSGPPIDARDLTAVANEDDGIDVANDGSSISGATVRDNGRWAIETDFRTATVRDLETDVGTFDRVEISDGGLLPPELGDYGEKAALPAVLNVSADTEYVDFTISYDDGDLPRGADESTLALFNATDADRPRELDARIDTTLNTISANVTSGLFEPLEDGGRIELVALADTVPVPNVSVTGVATNSPVVEGERLNLSATLENVGGTNATQRVSLSVGGAVRDSRSVTLAAGASATVELSWATGSGDAGDYTAAVATANDTATAEVTILAPAKFSVSSLRAPATLARGNAIAVNATVTNVGEASGSATVTYEVAGTTYGTETVSLAPDASTTVEFAVAGSVTSGFPTGDVTHGVYTENGSATATLTVESAGAGGPSPLGPDLQPPTDPDGDGVYEDATGDGTFNVIDVATFLARFGGVPDAEITFFDFKADGGINILDVAALLAET